MEAAFLKELKTFQGLRAEAFQLPSDRRMLGVLSSIYPLKMFFQFLLDIPTLMNRGDLLGSAIKVSPRQFPQLHDLVAKSAEVLNIPAPEVFVTQNPMMNASTLGPNEEKAIIVVNSRLIDILNERELIFVLGHEMGHIKSGHVLYHSIAMALTYGLLPNIPFVSNIAPLALMAWHRRSELTCDRAGMLVCQDAETAKLALAKLAAGSDKFVQHIDLDEYLKQLDEVSDTIGRFSEIFQSHPFLPKRIKAIDLFAQSDLYAHMLELHDTKRISLNEVDELVEQLLMTGKSKEAHYYEPIHNEDALALTGAFLCAWSEGHISDDERNELTALCEVYELPRDLADRLQNYHQEKPSFDELAQLLQVFDGEKENVFLTALDFVYQNGKKPSRRRKNILYQLGEVCGFSSVRAMEMVNRKSTLAS